MTLIDFLSDPTLGITNFVNLQLSPESTYHNQGVDGLDIGALIPAILSAESANFQPN